MGVELLLAAASLTTSGTSVAATATASATATIRVQRAVRLNDVIQRERENARIRFVRVVTGGKIQSVPVVEFE
jgi:hypothetical protein